jgi:hypothetical protein
MLECHRALETVNSGSAVSVNRSPEDMFLAVVMGYLEMTPEERCHYRSEALKYWGIRITPLPAGTSRSESASQSRAIKRLEDRGLIQRRNQCSGDRYCAEEYQPVFRQHRTTHLRFTPEGRARAELLHAELGQESTP